MEKGKRAIVTAYTHVAAQNIRVPGAICGTLHHCLHKYPCFSGVVVFDEASQTPVIVWAAVLRWILSGARFIVLGDFRSQFGAAYDRWRTQTMLHTDTENSAMFKHICGYNRVNFTTYRRGDDRAFFDLYTGMVGRPVAQCLVEVTVRFPTKPGNALWNLTVSNRHRKRLNAQLNAKASVGQRTVWIDKTDQTDGQGFWLFPGLHLIGCTTTRGVFNGQLYAVASITEASVVLRVLDSDQEVTLLRKEGLKCLRPAHALCFYAAQGRTLRGRVRLWLGHKRIETTHLIVGLSRATSPELVDVAFQANK